MSARIAVVIAAGALLVSAFNPAHLFPVKVKSAWTTLPTAPTGSGATVLPLDYGALGVRKRTSGVVYNVTDAPGDAPTGCQAWPAVYPKGSYNPTGEPRGGLGFYFPGPQESWWNDTSVTQALFSYAVYFPSGFQPVLGGKIPGIYGGADETQAYACSGGRQEDRGGCFDLRLMWREGMEGEIYAYLPVIDSNTAAVSTLKGTVIDDSFGYSVARGAFTFATGNYTVIAQRVQLNTVGKSDGELELWVDGKSVLHATGLQIRTQAATLFRGVHFQTFFGGSDSSWATPVDQTVYFTGMSGGIVEDGASSAQGKAAYPLGQATTTTHAPATVTRVGGASVPTTTTTKGASDGAAGLHVSLGVALLALVLSITL